MAEQQSAQAPIEPSIEQGVPQSMKPLLKFLEKNKKNITLATIGVLILAVCWSGLRWYNASQVKKTRSAMGKILLSTEGKERLDGIAKLAQEAPSSMKGALWFEAASFAMEMNQYDKAMDFYSQAADTTDADMATIAKLGQAKAALLKADAKQALAILQPLAKNVSDGLKTPVNRQLALAAELAGDKETAIAAYEVLNETGTLDKQFVEYKLARLKQ